MKSIRTYIGVCALILLVTFAANYSIIFLNKSMYLDDMGGYLLGLEGRLQPLVAREYPLLAYFLDIANRCMVTSLVFARVYITFFLVLSNIVLFYILYRLLKFSILLSFVAAIFPSILPGQTLIPGYIAGSYTVFGSLFLFLSILLAKKYIETKKSRWIYLLAFVLAYICSLLVMLNSVFYFLPLAFIFLAFNNFRINKRIQVLLFIIILADLYPVLLHLFSLSSFTSQTSVHLSIGQMWVRLKESIFYLCPVGFNSMIAKIMTGVFVVLISVGAFSWLMHQFKKIKTNNLIFSEMVSGSLPMWLGVIWFVSGSLVFWFTSPYFESRYFHLASYGSGMLIAFFILKIDKPPSGLSNEKFSISKNYGSIALLVLVSIMILSKISLQRDYVQTQNSIYYLYKNELAKIDYPRDSQIVVTDSESPIIGGFWVFSSGYLKYLTGRADITGNIFYSELQFYNPFNPSERKWNTRMTGIDLAKPIYLYRATKNKLVPVKYALQWQLSSWTKNIPGATTLGGNSAGKLIQSPWKIYEFDVKTGKNIVLKDGVGLVSYKIAVNNLFKIGVIENEILWAGPMSNNTKTRFGLN